jgi:hypothetical protein
MMSGKRNRTGLRRFASIMAAVGALLVSSGIALMAAPTAATAANEGHAKVVVCKYVGTPPGGLDHIIVVSENSMPEGFTGSFPYEWTDAQGQAGGSVAIRYAEQGEHAQGISLSECPSEPQILQAEAVAVPVEPTCDANVATYSTEGSVGVASWDESADPAFGTTITLTAHAAEGYAFGESDTTTVDVTFGEAATGCTVTPPNVEPPIVEPPVEEPTTQTVTPTIVEAGLAGEPAADSSRDQGLALVATGLALLAAAAATAVRKEGGVR